ncbi:MAG: DUF503 family protein [Frankiales bacterium]|nr:DUF503 family protein [Frankiales bacterium]
MFVGTLELDVLLGDVHSLKERRGLVRPVVADLRRRFEVTVAEVGMHDLHRRSLIGVAVVGADPARCTHLLDSCERAVAARPELELLSARRTLRDTDDD